MTPFPPMAATVAQHLPTGAAWSYEVKWDGYRALLLYDGARGRLLSRNLKDLTRDYPQIASAAAALGGERCILDGEIVAIDEHGRPSFQALQHRGVTPSAVVYYAFDLLQLGAVDYRSKALRERQRALARLSFTSPILLSSPLPGTPDEIEPVVRAAGLEGVVAKRLDSVYEPGIRSRNWIKVRFATRQEFVVGGYKPAGKGFDSVLVGYYEGRKLLYAGKVRAGFTPSTRADVWARIADAPREQCPFANLPNSTGRTHWGEGITADDMAQLRWVRPHVVVEVAFTEWTAGNNLRHASFQGMRNDKNPTDVVRET
jgi:DNA ligase D-like protein (predicted ligase)